MLLNIVVFILMQHKKTQQMKPKITPDEYRSVLNSLELDTLILIELKSKLKEEFISPKLGLSFKEKNTFQQEGNTLKVYYSFNLTAKDDAKEEPGISIDAKYVVLYSISKEIIVSNEFMRIFCDLTVSMLLWTYFRELVNNVVYRMGMPPLVLPLKRK
jgi:preprotein translocase subunit SecB